jgi:ABC-type phosphate transport system substrate-binding protein
MTHKPYPIVAVRWTAVAAIALACCTPVSAQVAVVVHPKSALATMTPEQAANIFLGKTPATTADLPEGSPVRDQFYTKATGKTPAQVKAIWARLTFSGKAVPPKELSSAAEVKKLVAADPEAIGYIQKSDADSSVKVVLELN